MNGDTFYELASRQFRHDVYGAIGIYAKAERVDDPRRGSGSLTARGIGVSFGCTQLIRECTPSRLANLPRAWSSPPSSSTGREAQRVLATLINQIEGKAVDKNNNQDGKQRTCDGDDDLSTHSRRHESLGRILNIFESEDLVSAGGWVIEHFLKAIEVEALDPLTANAEKPPEMLFLNSKAPLRPTPAKCEILGAQPTILFRYLLRLLVQARRTLVGTSHGGRFVDLLQAQPLMIFKSRYCMSTGPDAIRE
ncbi:hypothetical protein BDK51DRAFT_41107 [Blyttiomyces helicus]|uniref:Uncharacterized protein n=1 Tax=Blyttiomyces helicus TaxID=388810 RepID=A0A4P9W4E4_9FUNG|nr:hypothetical protein BDK51DRAFT_41107 [Blyttiomyces helicus]|eukprot:RKO86153.1 hypothetical protein BDK51DRAFT_41107 [Blyttiomyces helicus]